MMTIEQHILMKIAEEAAEVSQRALKAALFGPDETQPGQPDDNTTRLHHELADLEACLDEGLEIRVMTRPDPLNWLRWKRDKRIKLAGMLSYAQGLGRVER